MTALSFKEILEASQGAMPSSREYALHTLRETGYVFDEADLQRVGSESNANGFWCAQTKYLRVVCYGPGEYIGLHTHDRDELFHITQGWCTIVSQDKDETWEVSPVGQGKKIEIAKDTLHSLIASREGVCMHTNDLTPRTTTFRTE